MSVEYYNSKIITRHEQILSEVQKRFINDKTHIVSKVNAFIDGIKWADEHPDTEDLEAIMAFTFRGLSWLAENIEADMGTTRERALSCIETLQFLCNDVIMELRNKKNSCKCMKLWIKLQHWFYRILIDYKTKKIVEFNKEREKYHGNN